MLGKLWCSCKKTISPKVDTNFSYHSNGLVNIITNYEQYEYASVNGYLYLIQFISSGITATVWQMTNIDNYKRINGANIGTTVSAWSFSSRSNLLSTLSAAGTVQDYRYVFNAITGNLTSRQNYLRSKSESFTYNNLDRLLTVAGPQNLAMTFNANGNIKTKSDISSTVDFGYGTNAGPYALTGLSSSTGVIPETGQTATYTSFEKVNTLAEGVYAATFVYNSGNQRAKMMVTQSGSAILTRWYAGNSYMKETASGVTKEYTYIGGDAYSAPVAAITQSGTTTYYYLLRDHLGNITHQVNTSNVVVAEFSFDACSVKLGFCECSETKTVVELIPMSEAGREGRRRSADDWSYTLDGNDMALFADRGFTGHEHLKWFNLVNMNGRLYDPLVGRFLSVDPYIQDPGFTQEYNRYSYCLNNPLKHTDPSGYKKAPVKEDAFIMDYANYWNRRTLYGGGSGGGLNSFLSGGSGGPGGRNGTGLNGAYYDHSSSTYRSTGTGNPEVGWDYALSVAQNYASERWWRQDAYAGSSSAMAYKGSIWKYSSSFTSVENIGRNQIGDVINGETITGFSGGMPLRDMRSGEGDPITGMPSFIGGPLRKGQAALKVGKYLFNPSALHSVKKGVLAFTKPQNFAHIVGDNPDILFKGGKVFLTGAKTSSFYGKSYETSLSIIDFLKLF